MEKSNYDEECRDDCRPMSSTHDSWERFMILWGVTPEILVGSCILSVICIVVTYLVTTCGGKNRTNPAELLHGEFNDSCTDTCGRRKDNSGNKVSARELQLMNEGDVKDLEELPKRAKSSIPVPSTSIDGGGASTFRVPCKKNMYRFVSDKLQKTMTSEQLTEENDTKRKQLEAIYNLMRDQQELFGIENIRQVQEQMKLYG